MEVAGSNIPPMTLEEFGERNVKDVTELVKLNGWSEDEVLNFLEEFGLKTAFEKMAHAYMAKMGGSTGHMGPSPLDMNLSDLAEMVQEKYGTEIDTRAFYERVVEVVGDKYPVPPYEEFGQSVTVTMVAEFIKEQGFTEEEVEMFFAEFGLLQPIKDLMKMYSEGGMSKGPSPLSMNMSQLADYVQERYGIEVDTLEFYNAIVEVVGDKAPVPPYEDFGT
jgi:hypothetical protein